MNALSGINEANSAREGKEKNAEAGIVVRPRFTMFQISNLKFQI